MLALAGCNDQKSEETTAAVTAPTQGLLDDISGVWKAQSDNT